MGEEKDTNIVKNVEKTKKEKKGKKNKNKNKENISIGDRIFRVLILIVIFFIILLTYIFYVQGFLNIKDSNNYISNNVTSAIVEKPE